jgi:hypothetical protein
VTSGWSPGPPECRDDAQPAGTASAGWASAATGPESLGLFSGRLPPARSANPRHRLTPLSERGDVRIVLPREQVKNKFRTEKESRNPISIEELTVSPWIGAGSHAALAAVNVQQRPARTQTVVVYSLFAVPLIR